MTRKSSFIEFTPLPSSYSGKGKKETSATKKTPDKLQKIYEFEEHPEGILKIKDEIIEESSNKTNKLERKNSSNSKNMTKKGLFEEFLLIGIDKNEFLKIDTKNHKLKGYQTPQIIFQYPNADDFNDESAKYIKYLERN